MLIVVVSRFTVVLQPFFLTSVGWGFGPWPTLLPVGAIDSAVDHSHSPSLRSGSRGGELGRLWRKVDGQTRLAKSLRKVREDLSSCLHIYAPEEGSSETVRSRSQSYFARLTAFGVPGRIILEPLSPKSRAAFFHNLTWLATSPTSTPISKYHPRQHPLSSIGAVLVETYTFSKHVCPFDCQFRD